MPKLRERIPYGCRGCQELLSNPREDNPASIDVGHFFNRGGQLYVVVIVWGWNRKVDIEMIFSTAGAQVVMAV